MSLPPSYTNEINALGREVARNRPEDVLQFCANFFARRLESQRAEFLLSSGPHAAAGRMAESSFPGGNPFGASARGNVAMQQVREDDEMETSSSPTAPAFAPSSSPPSSSSAAPATFSPAAAPTTAATAGPAPSFSPFAGFGAPFPPPSGHPSPLPASYAAPPSSSSSSSSAPSEGLLPHNYALGRRTSVSAESMNPRAPDDDDAWTPPRHPKTPEQLARIRAAIATNFLFSHLADDQADQVLGALSERPVPARGMRVISQGDAGDNFYVVERGTFDVFINPHGTVEPGPDGVGRRVASIGPGGSFGELALMYNAPRAATVMSTEPRSLLWALDRVTFRRILMDSSFQRRRMYESFLEEVPLLSSLEPYERSKIADALETRKFPAGSTIIREGDAGEAFYLLEHGRAAVYKRETGDRQLTAYGKGDYFGELALLDDKPRAASVVSLTEVRVATLGKEGFARLLGPVTDRMRRDDPSKRTPAAGVDPPGR